MEQVSQTDDPVTHFVVADKSRLAENKEDIQEVERDIESLGVTIDTTE